MMNVMIGFGELRKRSSEWRQDLSVVERIYATDWLLKGIYDQAALAPILVLRGGSALRYAYAVDYPFADPPEFLFAPSLAPGTLHAALTEAVQAAAHASGLKYALPTLEHGTVKVEYTGPLGRRSAAQPHINLMLIAGRPRLEPTHTPLLHPFSDHCAATVSAIALEEWVAGQIIALSTGPRARDLFDLWFALVPARVKVDRVKVRACIQDLAYEKGVALPDPNALILPAQRSSLQNVWDRALRNAPHHPTFEQAEQNLVTTLHSL